MSEKICRGHRSKSNYATGTDAWAMAIVVGPRIGMEIATFSVFVWAWAVKLISAVVGPHQIFICTDRAI